MEHTYFEHEQQVTQEHMIDKKRHEQESDNVTLLPSVEDIWKEEEEYHIWLKNPSNVLAERDDSVVKALCYGP